MDGSEHIDCTIKNYIVKEFPEDLLRKVLGTLPASHRFVAPVCRTFRDIYGTVCAGKKKETNATHRCSVSSDAALRLYLDEGDYFCGRDYEMSRIGAGAGRTDWVTSGGVFDKRTCEAAARGGRLRVLKWLRGRDCPWDWRTCAGAARGGHLKTLQWAREQGCPWDDATFYGAAANKHKEVMMWAVQNGCMHG